MTQIELDPENLASQTDVTKFRKTVRFWLESNCPASMRTPMKMDEAPWGGSKAEWINPDTKVWLDLSVAAGLAVPYVPHEYGGAGLSMSQTEILYEELERIGARIPLTGIGPFGLAPTLLQHGTPEQNAKFLPSIARGESRWALGFSEPGAGSDLASLQTKAERDGDDYVLNGQKIWNSFTDKSDWMIVLARTKQVENKRHLGIVFLLVDLNSPGIDVRPLQLISGESEFCETFLEDVRVPIANRIGPEDGWSIVKDFLVHDRISGRFWPSDDSSVDLPTLWRKAGADCRGLWHDVMANELDHIGLRALENKVAELNSQQHDVSGFAPVIKYFGGETTKRRSELAALIQGERGLVWAGDLSESHDKDQVETSLYTKAHTLGGGSSEISLNLIAKNTLQLPSG